MQPNGNLNTANSQQSNPAAMLGRRFATWAANGFGSDIYMRVGTKDFWDSNQVAHAMMGFAGTSLTSLTIFWYFGEQYLCAGLLFMILPIWRDTIDYVVDSRVFDPSFSKPFLHKGEIFRDCLTDASFWFCGSLLAITTILAAQEGNHASSQALAWFLMATVITVAHGIIHYKPQKTAFDRSGIPYFVRLAKFNGEFLESGACDAPSDAAKSKARDTIADFLHPDTDSQLLIIAGDDESGKTTLACGIATEFAVWPKFPHAPTTRFILMGELFSMVRRGRGRYGSSGVVSDTRPISAAAADILVIDEAELTPDHLERLDEEFAPVPSDDHHVKISDGLKFLLLGKRRIVLVIHKARVQAWKGWLHEELRTEDDIPTIWIDRIVDDASVEPSRLAKCLSVGLYIALFVVGMFWLCALLYTPIIRG